MMVVMIAAQKPTKRLPAAAQETITLPPTPLRKGRLQAQEAITLLLTEVVLEQKATTRLQDQTPALEDFGKA
jgi:hypothetical protein